MKASGKRTVLVITGSRAEYGYLRPVLKAILASSSLALRLLVTGMHTQRRYGFTLNGIRKDRIPVARIVPVAEKATMLEALAQEIRGIERYCRRERPDLMLVIADRDEPLAGAIVAGHLGIPLVHLAGGDSTGFVVDEPIRHAISKFAHLHFTWTPTTARRLRALGEEGWRIHITGSTSFDEIRGKDLEDRSHLARHLHLQEKKPWILFVQHPVPLDPIPLVRQIDASLRALEGIEGQKIFLYPNADTGTDLFIKALQKFRRRFDTALFPSLPHLTYLALLKHAAVIVGNSSSGVIEAGFFGTPAVNIGGRQSGREHGNNVIHVSYNARKIAAAIKKALAPRFVRRARATRHPFDRGHASARIVKLLETLTLDRRLLFKRLRP